MSPHPVMYAVLQPNYDDFNECFWTSKCLSWGYHSLDDEAGIKASIQVGSGGGGSVDRRSIVRPRH